MLAALSLYCLGGLMLSASRAGVAATAVSAVVLAALLLRGRSRAAMKLAAIGGGLLAVLILAVAGAAFLHKLSLLTEVGNLNRVVIWRTSIEAWLYSPWLGWGLGSYSDIYAIHQPMTITQPNDKAHSTPLEFLVEMGIVGGVPALAACAIPWGVSDRRVAAAAASTRSACVLDNGCRNSAPTIDFSLQMPAIGFAVSALWG